MTLIALAAALVGVCAFVTMALCRAAAAGQVLPDTPLSPVDREPV